MSSLGATIGAFVAGQLEHPRPGDAEHRRPLRRPVPVRQRRQARAGAREPVVSARGRRLRHHAAGPVEGVRELRAVLRERPLDMVDRSARRRAAHPLLPRGGASGRNPRERRGRDGLAKGSAGTTTSRVPVGGAHDPNQKWLHAGGGKAPVDPDHRPAVVGRDRGRRRVRDPPERAGRRDVHEALDEQRHRGHEPGRGDTSFIGNPGKGIAKDFPEATRDYDAHDPLFPEGVLPTCWLAQVELHRCRTCEATTRASSCPRPTSSIRTSTRSSIWRSLLVNREGALPGDNAHEIKALRREGDRAPEGMVLDVGLTYRSCPAPPSTTGERTTCTARRVVHPAQRPAAACPGSTTSTATSAIRSSSRRTASSPSPWMSSTSPTSSWSRWTSAARWRSSTLVSGRRRMRIRARRRRA